MDRIDTAYTALRRTAILASADTDYAADPADQRPNRADRSDLGAIKDDDDVEMQGGSRGRVICPGPGRGYFLAWWYDEPTQTWFESPWEATLVIDRAPADPQETPMPIFPEPSP